MALPDHCEPANDFLLHLSSRFNACVPTYAALLYITLGTLSIVSWLFAQLPQIYRNWRLRSTSGLSIFFLLEWCLGDLSNLLGALFTRQATWQMVVAGYYCFVDSMLVLQWIWFEHLGRGRDGFVELRQDVRYRDGEIMQEVIEGVPPVSPGTSKESRCGSTEAASKPGSARSTKATPMAISKAHNSVAAQLEEYSLKTPTSRTITRTHATALPMASPRTMLFIALLIAIAQASPLTPADTSAQQNSLGSPSAAESAGRVLSWLSTLLYLGSRIPQLVKNHSRKSTAGLSPALFVAAFFGNLFYSASLPTNPCAWRDFAPYGGGGWVGAEGSQRWEWIGRAAPFWLGAAGVLVLDALVGMQFFWYAVHGNDDDDDDNDCDDQQMVVDAAISRADGPVSRGRSKRWQRVDGWMRGWMPTPAAPAHAHIHAHAVADAAERATLLGDGRRRSAYDGGGAYASV